MRKKNLKMLIGGLLIIGILIAIIMSVSSDNLTYYYTPTEILKAAAKHQTEKVRVMGLVEPGSVQWVARETKLKFVITDDDKSRLTVEYYGAKPDMFKEGRGVVVEGKLEPDGNFAASALFVKHTEEYKVGGHKNNKDDYVESLVK